MHHIIPKKPRCSKPTCEGREKKLFSFSAVQHPQGSAAQQHPSLQSHLEAAMTSWPLLSSCQRGAGRAELAGKAEPEQQPLGHGDSPAVAALQLLCLLRVVPLPKSSNGSTDRTPGSHRTSRRAGTVAGQGGWLPAWLVIRGR